MYNVSPTTIDILLTQDIKFSKTYNKTGERYKNNNECK